MDFLKLHDWDLTIPEARALQEKLAARVVRRGGCVSPRLIAGADISRERDGMATAAVVVLEYPDFNTVETRTVTGRVDFPYVPGLLTFREAPLILAACEQLVNVPGLFLVDGQGIAHPRRLGIAAHLGILLDTPTVGCAKSRLIGKHVEPPLERGSHSELIDNGEVIGAVLRTKDDCRPLYISIGNKINLESAVYWVLRCCREYRVPEPTRLAHIAAGRKLEEFEMVK